MTFNPSKHQAEPLQEPFQEPLEEHLMQAMVGMDAKKESIKEMIDSARKEILALDERISLKQSRKSQQSVKEA